MKNILVTTHTEDGFQPVPSVFLSDEEYGRGLQCFVPCTADIVIINREERTFYLARRKSKPVPGWCWIGGRMKPGELKEEAAARLFKRETKLELSPERFELVAVIDHRMNDRQQAPQELGCHMNAFTFVVELTPDELASISLDEKEYEAEVGLTAFSDINLAVLGVREIICELYNHIFVDEK